MFTYCAGKNKQQVFSLVVFLSHIEKIKRPRETERNRLETLRDRLVSPLVLNLPQPGVGRLRDVMLSDERVGVGLWEVGQCPVCGFM